MHSELNFALISAKSHYLVEYCTSTFDFPLSIQNAVSEYEYGIILQKSYESTMYFISAPKLLT